MSDAISSFGFRTAPVESKTFDADKIREQNSNSNHEAKLDKVTISGEAFNIFKAETRKPTEEDHSWSTFDFGNGQFKLDNGNIQNVKIEGSKLTIEEYDDDKLVRKVEGNLNKDGAVFNTQIFDENNKLIQEITTQFTCLKTGEKSAAKVSRHAQWFDDGKVTRTMEDSMLLESKSIKDTMASYGTTEISGDFNSLVQQNTTDKHRTEYKAAIIEYHNGRKTKEAHIKQKGNFQNLTNRANVKNNSMAARSTIELQQKSSLQINTTIFDTDGNIQQQTLWDESYKDSTGPDDGVVKQNMQVFWYNKGELVKKEHSSAKIKETESSKLEKRPNLLEMLGTSEYKYTAGNSAKSASQLLADPLMDASARSSFYLDNVKDHTSKGHYKSAFMVEDDTVNDRPYDLKWSSEIYKDGEKVAEQKETEKARKNPLHHGLEFWTGHGLTESESPTTIKSASHTDSSFEYGREKNTATISLEENAIFNHHGPDTISTSVRGTQKNGLKTTKVNKTVDGRIDAADTDLHAASKKINRLDEQMLDDTLSLLDPLDKDNPTPEMKEYHVRLKTRY
jgi:hypothetical protein